MGSSPSTYARKLAQSYGAMMSGKDYQANPPCGDCNACCRSGFDISFTPHADEGREYLFINGLLPKDPDGVCAHLIDDKCVVYDDRPSVCRRYDCRTLAFAGMTSKHPLVAEVVEQWDVEGSVRTHDDRNLLEKIPIEANTMVQRGDHIKDRLKLVGLLNRAIVSAAVKLGLTTLKVY